MSEASTRREKPKLDNARKLRAIYFHDPAGEEFKEIMQNARRRLEVPMPAAMLLQNQTRREQGNLQRSGELYDKIRMHR